MTSPRSLSFSVRGHIIYYSIYSHEKKVKEYLRLANMVTIIAIVTRIYCKFKNMTAQTEALIKGELTKKEKTQCVCVCMYKRDLIKKDHDYCFFIIYL
jgi:hypothetical protein